MVASVNIRVHRNAFCTVMANLCSGSVYQGSGKRFPAAM
ncbi:hypothetical protein [Azospirillum argentinense]